VLDSFEESSKISYPADAFVEGAANSGVNTSYLGDEGYEKA